MLLSALRAFFNSAQKFNKTGKKGWTYACRFVIWLKADH